MKSFSFKDFSSPFFDELKDEGALSLTFNRFPIVPFQGINSASADGVLSTLHRLSEVTPIYNGILQSIHQFTLGGGLKAIETTNNIFDNYKELSDSDSISFGELLNEKLYECDINDLLSNCLNGLLIDGNIGVKVRVSSTGKATIKFVSQKFFRYLKEDFTKLEKRVLISPTFVYDYLINIQPYTVPCYPNWGELENGAKETFFHFKESRIDRSLYGLSYAASSLMNQYLVNQVMQYLSAETDNRFTGQVLFDVPIDAASEDENGIEGIQLVKDLRKVFKSKGSGESIMVHFRSEDLNKIEVHEFKANTNEKFYETIRAIVNEEIITAFAWDKRLIGISRENGLGGNDMEAIFKVASMKVKRLQSKLETAFNTVLNALSELENFSELSGKGIKLNSLYEVMKESEIVAESVELETNQTNQNDNNTNGDN